MSRSTLKTLEWGKASAALSVVATAVGGALAAFWGLIAGLWTFSTADYGALVIVVSATAFLIGAPVFGFGLASRGRWLLSLAVTAPALLLYCAVLVVALSQ